jgi:hypothetical protein
VPEITDVLVFVHGQVTNSTPSRHAALYDRFFEALCRQVPVLKERFGNRRIFVEWGNQVGANAIRPDERLTSAQSEISKLVSYSALKNSGDDRVQLSQDFSWGLLLRWFTGPIREQIILSGFADVAYYCSPDGEAAVREAVYGQVLEQLRPYIDDNVRVHIVAHSLGCTVAFDFLYGLFAPSSNWKDEKPDFADNPAYGKEYEHWRRKHHRARKTLVLGSMTTMAPQLPVLLPRKQAVVDIFHKGERLDPTVIGLPSAGPIQWKSFFDVDDVLSFAVRRLFRGSPPISDIQVDTGWRPDEAHNNYWTDRSVISEVAELLDTSTA